MTTRHVLGQLDTGATVAFVRDASRAWGIEIAGDGAPRVDQLRPARLEVFRKLGEVITLATGYTAIEPQVNSVVGRATLAYGSGVIFTIEDCWAATGATLSVHRTVRVSGSAPGGFLSELWFNLSPEVTWADVDCFVPGVLYGRPPERGLAGTRGFQPDDLREYAVREDALSAPLLALSFANGSSLAVLDPAPHGDTTLEEVGLKQASVMLDERYRFGALGVSELPDGGLTVGFWLPGAVGAWGRLPERRRYSRILDGLEQSYDLVLRFAQDGSFREMMRRCWRWAWETLAPSVTALDLDLVRRVLADQLAQTVDTVDDRTGITWIFGSTTGRRWSRPDDTRVAMGFVGKNIEAADQLLREAERDPGPRGQRMRRLGLAIIDSFIRLVPLSPPAGDGFDLLTGEPTVSFPPSPWRDSAPARVFLRALAEDLRMLMEAYRRERAQGREHPEWLRWCQEFADWLLTQQRADGSFPRSWEPGTGRVLESSGSTSYNPVPLLVRLSQETRRRDYLDAALRAGAYVWAVYGSQGVFVGGTLDNPDVVDKEAGMLALEAFLTLYEATGEAAWLERARVAADFAETWIWIWNLPMPQDARDGELKWKRGVPTVGLQGITANPGGGVDEYMDWSTPAYAKLHRYTGDAHYREVARVLLYDTKAMLALPGRTYDLAGPGWQQEHWMMSLQRGIGGHGGWLPWVTTNHLYSITSLEAFDPALFAELSRPCD